MRFRSAILAAALVAFAGFHAHAQENAASTPHVVEMTATNYQFTPSEVHVKVGETVRLSITADEKSTASASSPSPRAPLPARPPDSKLPPTKTASNSKSMKPA